VTTARAKRVGGSGIEQHAFRDSTVPVSRCINRGPVISEADLQLQRPIGSGHVVHWGDFAHSNVDLFQVHPFLSTSMLSAGSMAASVMMSAMSASTFAMSPGDCMAIAEHRTQLQLDHPADQEIEHPTWGQRKVDGIGDAAALGSQGFELVAMFPVEEGSGLLKIDEEFVLLIIGMDRDLSHDEAQTENDAGTLLDAASAFERFHGLTGWEEQFQGIGAFVEGKERFDGGLDDGRVFKLEHSLQ